MISVVIPSYNRPQALSRCLGAIAALEFPRQFEVIVVNDGGDAPLHTTVAAFRDRFDINLVERPHNGPAAARNAGAARARGEHVAFLDDDCMPTRNWLQTLTARIETMPGHAIGGQTLNALPANLYASASQLLVDYLYEYRGGSAPPQFFASNNLVVPRNAFQAIGGFDVAFRRAGGEDRDLCDRWRQHGHPMTFAPEIVVYHGHDLTARTFCRQHFNYGRGALFFRRARAERTGASFNLEPFRFYVNLLLFPFSRTPGGRAPLLSASLVLSQLAHAAGFLWEGKHRP